MKQFKRILASIVLAMAMVVTATPAVNVQTVVAAQKLSFPKKIRITEDTDKHTLKVKGLRKNQSVKFNVDRNANLCINYEKHKKSIDVYGYLDGSGKIKAIVSTKGKKKKQTLICKVTVKLENDDTGDDNDSDDTDVVSLYTNSDTSISIKKGESKAVTIGYNGSGSVYYNSTDKSVASASWTKDWKDDETTLTITGNKAGSATVTVTGEGTDTVLTFTVNAIDDETPEQKLSAYIDAYGGTNSNGQKGIAYRDYKDGNSLTYSIVKESDHYSSFIMAIDDKNGTQSALEFETYIPASGQISVEAVMVGSSYGYNATATFNPSTYNLDDKLYWSITTAGYSDGEMTSLYQDHANACLKLACSGCDLMLETKVGISMTDLGFTNLWK